MELGCGPGANIWYLAREGFDAYGIDGSQTAISLAKNRMESHGLTANLQVSDMAHIDSLFPVGYFDAVIDIASVQHNDMDSVRIILERSQNVLKPKGRIFSMMVTSGSYGDGMGNEIEKGTFVDVSAGPPLHRRGLGHFFTLEEVQYLFGSFEHLQIEQSMRSMDNRQIWYNHWVVEGVNN